MIGRPSLMSLRSPMITTLAVWRALILREAVTRLFETRSAWIWVVLEPAAHIALMMFMFAVIRARVVENMDTPIWIMTGLLTFFIFRRPAGQCMSAISVNQALFAHRLVKPVDAVLSRGGLEGFLMILISLVIIGGAALMGEVPPPVGPLAILEACFGMWLAGLGFGLVASVAVELVPELGRIISFFLGILFFISGVIFPLSRIPSPYYEWLVLNPLVHGVDAARLGFAPYYGVIPDLSVAYLYGWALGLIFLGLALHAHFESRLVSK